MQKTFQQRLEEELHRARECFYAWRLAEAYPLLRRYFDRMPFQPEPGHAEFIGIFARLLLELGREGELRFYLTEFERLYASSPEPFLGYSLAVIYGYYGEGQPDLAKRILYGLLADTRAASFHAKARMMLADYYDREDDLVTARCLIEGIHCFPDFDTELLSRIWVSYLLGREGLFEASVLSLEPLWAILGQKKNGYAYFSAKVAQAVGLIGLRDEPKAYSLWKN